MLYVFLVFTALMLTKEWALSRSSEGKISVDVAKCNRSYTRFRTSFMDGIFPDAPGTKSGWNTENHYFYEIVNRTGKSAYIQLALSSKEMPEDQLETSDRINEFYPTKWNKEDWQWRTPFRTQTLEFEDLDDKEAIFTKLDTFLQDIDAFETDLRSKL